MSQENVEIARQALGAFTRRDIAAMRAINDPGMEIDWTASGGWLAGVYRGIDESMRFFAGFFDVFEEIVIEPEGFVDAGESVVVPNVSRSLGRDGIEVFARSTLVLTIRARKITRLCLYQETEEALEAVGLAE
jgi:ketosteroid isomerase-like protein